MQFFIKMQVAYNENLDGGGSASIKDAVSVTKMFLGDQKPKSVLEMFSGPGFWGFGLLDANIGIETLSLADKYGIAEDSINETIKNNNLKDVYFHQTDCFDRIEGEYDLIVGNPPHFCIDPFNKHYTDPRKYKDTNWSIHHRFFSGAQSHLKPNGKIILMENIWGSSPETFKVMTGLNDLQITRAFTSKVFENELYYMEIVKKDTKKG